MPRHILLCDDEIHIVRAAEFKLKRAGYDVRIAGDGEEGWQCILQRTPDLVITDCQMPRLDGLGLIRRMREYPLTANTPAFMLTAKGFELSAEDLALQLQVRRLLAKPFSPRELLELVDATLAETPAALTAASPVAAV